MSDSLLHGVAREIAALLAPIRTAVESPLAFERLIDALGLVSRDNAELLESLKNAAVLATRLEELAVQQKATLETLGTVLDTSETAFALVRGLSGGTATEVDLERLGRDLVELLVADRLGRRYPVAREVAVLLTLLEPAERQPPPPVEMSNGEALRIPEAIDRFHLERITDLLRDPVGTLRAAYVNDLQTDEDAKAVGEKLFAPLVRLLTHLGVSCRYGIPRDDLPLLGDTAPFISHALVVYVDDELNGAEVEAGVLLAISPASRGDLGLVVVPFGSIATTRSPGSWTVNLKLSAGVQAIAYGRHGFTLLASPGTIDVTGSVEATLITSGEEPAYVLGAPDGVRLEIGGARLAMEAALSEAGQRLAFSADLSPGTFVMAPADADGFLASLLPAEGIRTTFDLGVGWSSDKGVTFRGHAGLDATIPVVLSLAGLTLSSVHLGLKAQEGLLVTEVAVSLGASIGPVRALVDRIGLEAVVTFPEDGGNVGIANLDLGFKPPNGLGLVIDASVVLGGGFLIFDPQKEEYGGMLELQIAETIAVKAIGLLTTRMPDGGKGYSLVVIIFVEGFPPIQLGFGFTLTGIGGLLAINRTFDVEALRAGLKNHTLDSVMFPKDPIRNAPQILSNLNRLFPPANGHHLFGPMVQIAWGTPTLITADLGVVLELGARLRLLILAQVVAILPKPENDLVRLQMDAIGVIDFDQGTAELDATLHDSRLLKKFVLTGDMAMRLKWEPARNFALAIGGLHPAFNPPPNFPKLERIAINLCAGDNPRIRCEAYFALTANTVQFGARVELYVSVPPFSIQGEYGYDVLIQFDPFYFLADFYAQLQLKRGSTNLFKVRVEGALAGPRPLHIKAKATFEILWWDYSIRIDRTLIEGEKPPPPEPIDVLPRLKEALGNPGNWISQLPDGQRPMVTLRAKAGAATEVLLHPLGTLTVKQGVVPLNLDISRFGQAAPAGARHFTISSVSLGGQNQTTQPVKDFFAPAQFFEMSDDEKLSRPSFEPMAAGVSIGSDEIAFTADANDWLEVQAIEYETWIVDKQTNVTRRSDPEDPEDPMKKNLYKLSPKLLSKQARFGAAGNSDIRRTGRAKYRTTMASFKITEQSLTTLKTEGVPDDVLEKLQAIKNQEVRDEERFLALLKTTIGDERTVKFKLLIMKHATTMGKHRIVKEGWSIVATDDLTVQPVPGIEDGKPRIYSEAAQALRKLKQADPAKAAGLKILRLSELL